MGINNAILILMLISSSLNLSLGVITRDTRQGEDVSCSEQGFFRNKEDCTKFYRCAELPLSEEGALTRYEFECPPGTIFDDSISTCNHVNQVQNPPADCVVSQVDSMPASSAGSEVGQEPGASSISQSGSTETPILVPEKAMFYYPNLYYRLPHFYYHVQLHA